MFVVAIIVIVERIRSVYYRVVSYYAITVVDTTGSSLVFLNFYSLEFQRNAPLYFFFLSVNFPSFIRVAFISKSIYKDHFLRMPKLISKRFYRILF